MSAASSTCLRQRSRSMSSGSSTSPRSGSSRGRVRADRCEAPIFLADKRPRTDFYGCFEGGRGGTLLCLPPDARHRLPHDQTVGRLRPRHELPGSGPSRQMVEGSARGDSSGSSSAASTRATTRTRAISGGSSSRCSQRPTTPTGSSTGQPAVLLVTTTEVARIVMGARAGRGNRDRGRARRRREADRRGCAGGSRSRTPASSWAGSRNTGRSATGSNAMSRTSEPSSPRRSSVAEALRRFVALDDDPHRSCRRRA